MMRPPPLSIADLLRLSAWPFALAGAAVSLCYAAAGETLGFYLGPMFAVTLILPVMVSAQTRLLGAIVVGGAMVDAVGIAWLIPVFGPNLALLQWLQCYLVLAAYAFALAALTSAFPTPVQSAAPGRIMRPSAFPPAVVTLLGVAWLTWPIWTAPFLNITLAGWLTPAHPLMAMNSIVLDYGVWLEHPLMYRHTTLNQDVPYALPRSIWPCVLVHAFIAVLLLAPAGWRARSRGWGAAGEGSAARPG